MSVVILSFVLFVSRCVFELEMEGVKQSAVRDGIREQCAQLQLQAREGQDAIRTLQTQWQSVMDFRQLVVCNCYLLLTKDCNFIVWSYVFFCVGQKTRADTAPDKGKLHCKDRVNPCPCRGIVSCSLSLVFSRDGRYGLLKIYHHNSGFYCDNDINDDNLK